jgi:hypothetical protein
MGSVTGGGPGLVAVGFGISVSDQDAAAWTTPDGITWSRYGTSVSDLDATVWTSVDGITWSRVPHDEAVFGGEGNQSMSSVTAGGPGLVAVGSEGSVDDLDAAVWTSVDGITWSRVPHDEAAFGGLGNQVMVSVIGGGSGLVAVGAGDHLDAGMWTSADGITWTRVPDREAVFGGEGNQTMTSVTGGGPNLVAVGLETSLVEVRPGTSVSDQDAAVWVASDNWSGSKPRLALH